MSRKSIQTRVSDAIRSMQGGHGVGKAIYSRGVGRQGFLRVATTDGVVLALRKTKGWHHGLQVEVEASTAYNMHTLRGKVALPAIHLFVERSKSKIRVSMKGILFIVDPSVDFPRFQNCVRRLRHWYPRRKISVLRVSRYMTSEELRNALHQRLR